MNRNLAPITLTVFDRYRHTRQTLDALAENDLAKDSELFIFSDAPQEGKVVQAKDVAEVRQLIRKYDDKFKQVTIVEREENWGLAKSIITGVTELVNKYGKVIVMEDDLVTSPGFLTYMNDALDFYKDEEKVMHISGFFIPHSKQLPETVFYNTGSTWGWATWKRAWQHFNNNIEELDKKLKESGRMHEFNLEGAYEFYRQVKMNLSGKKKTWGIRWYASMFLMNGLALHPGKSLVQNIGNDNSGTNTGDDGNSHFHAELAEKVHVSEIPLLENREARETAKEFYRKVQGRTVSTRFKRWLEKNRLTSHLYKLTRKIIRYLTSSNYRNEVMLNRRVWSMSRFTPGESIIFGKQFKFIDSLSFAYQKEEIIEKQIYNFVSKRDPYIIDAGANIGLSVIYFKNKYPTAEVVAFESDPKIAEVTRENISQFNLQDVTLVEKALWSEITELKFSADGSDGGKVSSDGQISVPTDLLSKYINKRVDFLKIDIEGAEYQVLEEAKDKLEFVDRMFVEYHSFAGEEQNLHKILTILHQAGFRYHINFVGLSSPNPSNKVIVNNVGHDNQLNIFAYRE
jgi:FkbM family methyltransferase